MYLCSVPTLAILKIHVFYFPDSCPDLISFDGTLSWFCCFYIQTNDIFVAEYDRAAASDDKKESPHMAHLHLCYSAAFHLDPKKKSKNSARATRRIAQNLIFTHPVLSLWKHYTAFGIKLIDLWWDVDSLLLENKKFAKISVRFNHESSVSTALFQFHINN